MPLQLTLPRFLESVRMSLCARTTVELQKPFHTPLHLCHALERTLDLSKHAKAYALHGGLELREEFHFNAQSMLLSAKAPTAIRVSKGVSKGGRAVELHVTYGSPERLMLDALMAAVLVACALFAFSSGTPAIGALFLFCLSLGITPTLLVEARSRRLFSAALRDAAGLSKSGAAEDLARAG